MPALPPPSMQIGALPPGQSTLTPQPSGPPLAYGANLALPGLVQQVAGASSSAAPASFTLGGITATQVGTFLVLCVALATSASPTVTTPTNWTVLGGTQQSNPAGSQRGRIYVYPNNPGGITSVAFTTLANVNGIAMWFAEFSNTYVTDPGYAIAAGLGNGSYFNSSTAPNAPSYSPITGPVLLVGLESDNTGQVYTAANVGSGWVAGTSATSTNGASNCVIRPFYVVATPVLESTYQIAGSLAGSVACGASMASLVIGTSGPLLQPAPLGFPQGAAFGAAWGPLGGTKPGGAGSGQ